MVVPQGESRCCRGTGRAVGAAQAEPCPPLALPSLLHLLLLENSFLLFLQGCVRPPPSVPRPALGLRSEQPSLRPALSYLPVYQERSTHQGGRAPWWIVCWRPLGATSALPMASWPSPEANTTPAPDKASWSPCSHGDSPAPVPISEVREGAAHQTTRGYYLVMEKSLPGPHLGSPGRWRERPVNPETDPS